MILSPKIDLENLKTSTNTEGLLKIIIIPIAG